MALTGSMALEQQAVCDSLHGALERVKADAGDDRGHGAGHHPGEHRAIADRWVPNLNETW